jgi:hypothetical protein
MVYHGFWPMSAQYQVLAGRSAKKIHSAKKSTVKPLYAGGAPGALE